MAAVVASCTNIIRQIFLGCLKKYFEPILLVSWWLISQIYKNSAIF